MDEMDEICENCIAELISEYPHPDIADVTVSCVLYEKEPGHWARMLDSCPKLNAIIEEIMNSESIEAVKEEIRKQEMDTVKKVRDLARREVHAINKAREEFKKI